MIIKTLYRYQQGETTIDSLEKPDCTYVERYRLIADEGKSLTADSENLFLVIDIDQIDLELWTEVDSPEEPEEDTIDMSKLSPLERRALLLASRGEEQQL